MELSALIEKQMFMRYILYSTALLTATFRTLGRNPKKNFAGRN